MRYSPTPLRYPGGKQKMYPFMKKVIQDNFENKPVFIEPFAGGAGLGLKLLQNKDISHLILVEKDIFVACFYYPALFFNRSANRQNQKNRRYDRRVGKTIKYFKKIFGTP